MKIIIIATTSWNVYNSRLNLARSLKKQGHDVVLLAPFDEFTQFLLDEGFRWENFPLKPRGKNIFQEFNSLLFMISFYRREKPDLVNHFTPKGVIYGSIAAKIAGVPAVFNTITGLGVVFSGKSNHPLSHLVTFFYRLALQNTTVLFQNPDDQKFFDQKKIVEPKYSYLILGSGIDTEKFQAVPEPESTPIVLLSARFVEEKGIRYFVEASRILKKRQIEIRFVLVGRPEIDQPSAITLNEITKWVNEGVIEWWGWHNNMEQILPMSHICCLPTYYKEGIPKSLIEAAACGRPLIATNVPGCREIVRDGENGILIPQKDALALANAIEKLAENKELRIQMGLKSREMAIESYSLEKIINRYFEIYRITQ